MLLLLREETLSLERSDAPSAGTRNCLAVLLVLDVAGGKDTLDRGEGRSGLGDDVAVRVDGDLAADERRCRLVACACWSALAGVVWVGEERTDGVEETVDGEVLDLAGLGVTNCDRLKKVLRAETLAAVAGAAQSANARRRPWPRSAPSSRER